MLSLGMRASLAFCTASASEGLPATSPPPSRAATWIARVSLVKAAPRLASTAFFLCLIDAHLEWPDMVSSLGARPTPVLGLSIRRQNGRQGAGQGEAGSVGLEPSGGALS